MTVSGSNLLPALEHLSQRSARGIVARARVASPGLNRLLLRELSAPPGRPEALTADPVFESAKVWEPAGVTIGSLAPNLLSPAIVQALDEAPSNAMQRYMRPYAHQLAAWQESLTNDKSVLVTAGTGAGKTECFLIPILQDILANPRAGGGVRAILLYPLNALIESQRERLAAWAGGLGGRVRFALFNGDTPEKERQAAIKSDAIELRSRQAIRSRPPEILVTNITMLEYMLLRPQDSPLLEASQGALRWIVLDEAHGYIGSQAAEMALLLRRVRASFGVEPGGVRLMATSATIGGESNATAKLRAFAAALSGRPESDVAVVEGRTRAPELPPAGADAPLDLDTLGSLAPEAAGQALATNPRVQTVEKVLREQSLSLTAMSQALWGSPAQLDETVRFLDLAGSAPWQGKPLLPWRAHLFHRAQGGVWACPDPGCTHRAPELTAPEAAWPFGAVYLSARARCECGAPVYEIVSCTDCGAVHLQGTLEPGAQPRLMPPDPGEGDDFALDQEPEDSDELTSETGTAWVVRGAGIWLADDGRVFDNSPPNGLRTRALRLIEQPQDRRCCASAERARLAPLRFGPAFFMGASLGGLLEDLSPPAGRPGLPAGGRRALSFSDSRQGVARLAAKLQQDSERTLTRAFLWHAVQEGPQADPVEVEKLRNKIAKMRAAGLEDFAADDEARLAALTGAAAAPIPWPNLVQKLAGQSDLTHFAGAIWRERWLGQAMRDDPSKLAEMFLYRELFRRPRIQNNPETMGLVRLTFPKMADRARLQGPPAPLAEAGFDGDGWAGVAQAAVDMVFRNNFAIHIEPRDLSRLINPRQPGLRSVFSATISRDQVRTSDAIFWPKAISQSGRTPRVVELLYALTGGNPDVGTDQDRVGDVLDALWSLIAGMAARDTGQGAWRLDFSRAAVERLDRAWLCPVSRRLYGYSLAGRSPNDPSRRMEQVELPRLPIANAGGLTENQREGATRWTESDPQVAALRDRGLWSDLHDRLASYPPYVRAQEHSAQIQRATLQRYEEAFNEGRINLLNCSTTMEMGVDIADVRLVVNANVPPALSNYRQRAGRAGRRGEPWAFTLTFCRDLPLDRRVFDSPTAFLQRQIVAPKVWFDSPVLVQRHVNAALLATWLGERGGQNVRGSIGAFVGAGTTADEPVLADAPANAFLNDLDGEWGLSHADALAPLVVGTVLDGRNRTSLVAQTRQSMDDLVLHWRNEHRVLLEGAAAAAEPDAKRAMELRAKRLAGEFLLGELARRGLTPAYGFPTDVVTFTNLTQRPADGTQGFSHMKRGTASRPLDQALREYAPGAEVVIDGLVHQSEGILPAWEAGADNSRLEDLRTFWECPSCHAFGLTSTEPGVCPQCERPLPIPRRVLRPAGFLGAKAAHVGYENLAHVAPDPVRLSAQRGDWLALPEGAGRMRADPSGQVAVTSAGRLGGGLAICLDCGRAEPMEAEQNGIPVVLPNAIRRHLPLFRGRSLVLTQDGYCPSANAPHRIQRHVHLAQVTHTDVWEWQMPANSSEGATRALAAALREALAERLGVELDEIGTAADCSIGASGDTRLSLFLHDRASGGAGLVARMAEPEMLAATLEKAKELLDCPEACLRGCPSCILRPDLNQRGTALDRPGALAMARTLSSRLALPIELQLFGSQTRLAAQQATSLIATSLRARWLDTLDIWLHGDPSDWSLTGWPLRSILPRLAESGVTARLHLSKVALTAAGLDLPRKLALHAIGQHASLHVAEELPLVGGFPVIARLRGQSRDEALATTALAEAVPGDDWGAGAAAPAIVGPSSDLPIGSKISAGKLVSTGLGNARLLRPGGHLDGAATGFGRRFWAWLNKAAPLDIGALQSVGVATLRYSDRYLLQPYTLVLLADVLRHAPGGAKDQQITLAQADRSPADPRYVHDGFPSDRVRREVMTALAPQSEVILAAKTTVPHHRSLVAELADGRKLTLFLDQGFGGWRVQGVVRHDFSASTTDQARALLNDRLQVVLHKADDAPLAMTMD